MAITESQMEIAKQIISSVSCFKEREIVYRSEWLGYLPFGVYHWIECKDQDISKNFPSNWQSTDILALEKQGYLTKVSEYHNPDDEFDTKIIYEVNQHA